MFSVTYKEFWDWEPSLQRQIPVLRIRRMVHSDVLDVRYTRSEVCDDPECDECREAG